jgi:hypothetical protein
MGHAKVIEALVAILTIVFVFWQTAASKWIIFAAAVVLLIHALCCKCFCSCEEEEKPAKKKK